MRYLYSIPTPHLPCRLTLCLLQTWAGLRLFSLSCPSKPLSLSLFLWACFFSFSFFPPQLSLVFLKPSSTWSTVALLSLFLFMSHSISSESLDCFICSVYLWVFLSFLFCFFFPYFPFVSQSPWFPNPFLKCWAHRIPWGNSHHGAGVQMTGPEISSCQQVKGHLTLPGPPGCSSFLPTFSSLSSRPK